jgi:hypothetical protein
VTAEPIEVGGRAVPSEIHQFLFGIRRNFWYCKAIPLQAWTGPEGSRRLRLPDFKTIGT